MINVLDIIGWAGAVFILIAYLSLSIRKVRLSSKLYFFWNVSGAICIGINSYYNHAFPSVLANFFWLSIAIYGFYKLKKNQKEFKKFVKKVMKFTDLHMHKPKKARRKILKEMVKDLEKKKIITHKKKKNEVIIIDHDEKNGEYNNHT